MTEQNAPWRDTPELETSSDTPAWVQDKTLTWRRASDGNYVAIDLSYDPAAVYSVGRNTMAPTGQQWYVEHWMADEVGQPGSVTARRGFHSLKLAKAAALSTHCFRCGRWRELAQLVVKDPDKAHRNRWPSFLCKDTVTCDAEYERIRGVEREALVRKPHNVFEVRETEFGPDLVVGDEWEVGGTHQGSKTVIGCTEADLDAIETMLRTRREARDA